MQLAGFVGSSPDEKCSAKHFLFDNYICRCPCDFPIGHLAPHLGNKKIGRYANGYIRFGNWSDYRFFFGPIGLILGPFVGALAGELTQSSDVRKAVRAAFGSLVGFLAGTMMKFTLAVVYLILFVNIFWKHKELFF